jgi:hypothetical protein
MSFASEQDADGVSGAGPVVRAIIPFPLTWTILALVAVAATLLRRPVGRDVFFRLECNLEGVSCVVSMYAPSSETTAGAMSASRIDTMTDIEKQRILIMATTAIAAVVWAIANLA